VRVRSIGGIKARKKNRNWQKGSRGGVGGDQLISNKGKRGEREKESKFIRNSS